MSASFHGMSLIKIEEHFLERVSIIALWKKTGIAPSSTIMMNTSDHWHMKHHILPLVAGLESLNLCENVSIRFFSNPEAGHNPPPAHRLLPVMKEIMGS